MPVAIFAMLTAYISVSNSKSADAAIFDPSDCGSLEAFAIDFVNTLQAADEEVRSDIAVMNSNGPNVTGTDAAVRLDTVNTTRIPEWEEQHLVLENDQLTLNCDDDAHPGIDGSIIEAQRNITRIDGAVDEAQGAIDDTIVSEDDGYDPCEDTASLHSAPATVGTTGDGPDSGPGASLKQVITVDLSESKYPESTKHIKDAIANGKPKVLTINRAKCKANRKASLKGLKKVPGKDLDEYPFAMTDEGGAGASVRAIGRSDNRGSGSTVGNALRGQPDGTQFEINITP